MFVAALIRFYLREEPIIREIPTFSFSDINGELNHPLFKAVFNDPLAKNHLVLKRVDGRGGDAVWVGPKIQTEEFNAVQTQILQEPAAFIVQRYLALSQLDGHLVDLRNLGFVNYESIIVSHTLWGRGVPVDGNDNQNNSIPTQANQTQTQLSQDSAYNSIRQPVTVPSRFEPRAPVINYPNATLPPPYSHPIQSGITTSYFPTPGQNSSVKFETALEFLDQVKHQFAAEPDVYKHFLKIMKDFKNHEIDTPGVIMRVSELFRGQHHLILGFNQFLPEGHKIELADIPNILNMARRSSSPSPPVPQVNPVRNHTILPSLSQLPQHNNTTNINTHNPPQINQSLSPPSISIPSPSPMTAGAREVRDIGRTIHTTSPKEHNHTMELPNFQDMRISTPNTPTQSSSVDGNGSPTSLNGSPSSGQSSPQQRKQPELDQARNYVKKIKMRFESQPEIYKSFLRILHNYHEEHHTIKDVYDQVATLFNNHVDLLTEFKQFLPEETPANNDSPIIRSRRLKSKRRNGSGRQTSESPRRPTSNEYNFFDSAKSQLRGDSHLYTAFIKVLSLYNDEILSKSDLMILTQDLFSEYPELFAEFRQFCDFSEEELQSGYQGSLEVSPRYTPMQPAGQMIQGQGGMNQRERAEREREITPAPVIVAPPELETRNEIDFSVCKRYGPSYRTFPDEYVPPSCSGRTKMQQRCLNDRLVSVPVGSEDGFKASRKNQYEEILFKCEDDRYELDMVIESNTSAIMALLMIVKKIAAISDEELKRFKLDDGLDIIHIRAIERVYGEKGRHVIQGISQNPVVAIPTILRRLRQKDYEWRAARNQWNNIWKEVNDKNYLKSLDHQSMYFKQKEKKTLNPRELLLEIKKDRFQENEDSTPTNILTFTMIDTNNNTTNTLNSNNSNSNSTSSSSNNHMAIDNEDSEDATMSDTSSIFSDIEHLIEFQAHKMCLPAAETEKLETFCSFVNQFFRASSSSSTSSSASASSSNTSLFFGNNSFYVFFRFYQMLFSRLSEAKSMAAKMLHQQSKNVEQPTKRVSSYILIDLPTREERFNDVEGMYNYYLKDMLRPLLAGDLDPVKYEDECRDVFGISSYILFTMDKLLQALVKQIQSIFLEEVSTKLIGLHSYEAVRSKEYFESIYYTHALDIIGEDRCFKFKYTENGEFVIQLIDSSSVQQPGMIELSVPTSTLSPSPLPSLFLNSSNAPSSSSSLPSSSATKEKSQSVKLTDPMNIQQTEPLDNDRKHNVFLRRNKNSTLRNPNLANKKVISKLGLECKVCMSTYRLFYVEETEDFFYRVGQLARAKKYGKCSAKKKARLDDWTNSCLAKIS